MFRMATQDLIVNSSYYCRRSTAEDIHVFGLLVIALDFWTTSRTLTPAIYLTCLNEVGQGRSL